MVGKLAGKPSLEQVTLMEQVTSMDLVLHSPTFEAINFDNVIIQFIAKLSVETKL